MRRRLPAPPGPGEHTAAPAARDESRERAALWLQRTVGNQAAAGLLSRAPDPHAFDPVKELSPAGSLPASEWDPKTRTGGDVQLFAEVAALAGADRMEGVKGTATSDINAVLRKGAELKTGLNYVANLGDNGETGYIDSSGAYKGATLPQDGGLPTVAIMLGPTAFKHGKAHALATVRHEMKHAEHYLLAIHSLERWRKGKKDKTFAKWIESEEREPNRTLIRERIAGLLPNTEVLAYTEGLVASFQFIPQAPDPAGMKPGEYPVAIFELMMAGREYQAASPHVTKAAFERLRDYCQNVLSAAQRSALVAWIDHLLTYATDKQPPLRKGEDAQNAAGVWKDFKNLGGFLRQVRKIALEK